MKFDHNQVQTQGDEVQVGECYQYKEDSWIADVRVLATRSDGEGIGFKLEVLQCNYPLGEPVFDCWAALGHYGYNGMWRLYDAGTYDISDDGATT